MIFGFSFKPSPSFVGVRVCSTPRVTEFCTEHMFVETMSGGTESILDTSFFLYWKNKKTT